LYWWEYNTSTLHNTKTKLHPWMRCGIVCDNTVSRFWNGAEQTVGVSHMTRSELLIPKGSVWNRRMKR
jgi:hypothetical protein